jgi:hypothetical protein
MKIQACFFIERGLAYILTLTYILIGHLEFFLKRSSVLLLGMYVLSSTRISNSALHRSAFFIRVCAPQGWFPPRRFSFLARSISWFGAHDPIISSCLYLRWRLPVTIFLICSQRVRLRAIILLLYVRNTSHLLMSTVKISIIG